MTTKQLEISVNEKDVENIYRQHLSKKIKGLVFTSPYGCDGYGETSKIGVLCEFKYDLDLENRKNIVSVIAQSIYYIKKFEISGKKLPKTIFVGDKNECFIIHVNKVFKYLSYDYDWSVAPSKAHTNIDLVTELMSDGDINPYIFNVSDIDKCIDKMISLTEGVKRLIPITKHNLTEVFNHFDKKVLGKKVKLTTNEKANLFIQLIINPEDNYLHPKKNKIVTKSFGDVTISDKDKFKAFFDHFSRKNTPREKEVLTSMVDRLVEDVTRRKQGEFFTPSIWVDKAHEYIESVYGENWKEEYVVWDPAWGTGNLTRDYKFKELYVSTLNQSDIDTAEQMGYNPEAVKFQYDFLNDDYEKLPEGLRKAIEDDRKIIVLMNPPYSAGSNSNFTEGGGLNGMSSTIIGEKMSQDGLGKSKQQLYSQFIYRCINFNLDGICIFSPALLMSGSSLKPLRGLIDEKYEFVNGYLMDSSEFTDVKSWGLSFTIWCNFENNKKNMLYKLDLLTVEDFGIIKKDIKTVYNTDDRVSLSDWIRNDKYKSVKQSLPTTNGLNLPTTNAEFKQPESFLGYLHDHSNNVQYNVKGVGIYSTIFSGTHGVFVTQKNFSNSVIGFTVRRIIQSNWVNQKDEYLKPNDNDVRFNQFYYDSLVYQLFNNSSFQTSLRQIEYKGKLWDIKNEFFWISVNQMKELADENEYDNLYNDARTASNRHVYNLLFGEERIYDRLSPDAKLVLDKATEMVKESMKMRKFMADDENHLDSWDAGYAQLKLVWKKYMEKDFKEFRQLYKNLEERMRPLVYELGFLMK